MCAISVVPKLLWFIAYFSLKAATQYSGCPKTDDIISQQLLKFDFWFSRFDVSLDQQYVKFRIIFSMANLTNKQFFKMSFIFEGLLIKQIPKIKL